MMVSTTTLIPKQTKELVLNSDFDPTLFSAGAFLLIVLSCIIHLIRRGQEEASKREFESIISRTKTTPIVQTVKEPAYGDIELKKQNDILRQILTAIKSQPKSQAKTKPSPKPTPAPKPIPTPESQHTTSDEIIQEVIAALVKMGHTKTEAKKIVSELCESSTFNSSEELIQAVFSK
jgi:hypothetical protein